MRESDSRSRCSSATAPATTSSGDLAVVESGDVHASLVALVHGSMDRMAGFTKLTRRLGDRYRVLRYDRRGYGQSRAVPGPYTIATHVDDLVALLDGRPALVFGHSLGGNIALAAAQRHPDVVRGAITFESPLTWQPWWPRRTAGAVADDGAASPADVAERFMRRMIGDSLWERLPDKTRAERRAEGVALVGELTDLRANEPWVASAISTPVIAARGELGAEHHARGMAWLAARLGCPLVVVPGARHGAHSSHPDAMAALIDELAALVDV